MNKNEFLDGLREALSGDVPPAVVQEQLQYYTDYIRTELQNGRSEDEIMAELGDPRLIARTIEDTTPGAEDGAYEPYSEGSRFGNGGGYQQGSYRQESPESDSRGSIHFYDLNKWYWKLLGIVLAVVFFGLVISLLTGFLSLVIHMLPAIGLVLLVMWFVRGGPKR